MSTNITPTALLDTPKTTDAAVQRVRALADEWGRLSVEHRHHTLMPGTVADRLRSALGDTLDAAEDGTRAADVSLARVRELVEVLSIQATGTPLHETVQELRKALDSASSSIEEAHDD